MPKSSLAAIIVVSVFMLSTPTALEQFQSLSRQAQEAGKSDDKQARLQILLKMQKLLNNAPDAIEAVAEAYAAVGDTNRAITALAQFAELGQADDNLIRGKNKTFSTLKDLPQYKSILKHLETNQKPVSRAEMAFTLPDSKILPEDIDYDPQSNSFLITSVLEKKIIRLTSEGKAADFARSPSHWPMLAIKVDGARNIVWATEVAMDGFTSVPRSDWGRSALLCFDLRTGALRHRIEGPPHSALGDMALAPMGDPIVSDGGAGGIYRVNGARLERMDRGDFISPQTPAMHPDGKHVFIPDYDRGIGALHLASGRVTWFNQDTPPKHALNGIDGLYWSSGSLIATQNGTSPERVIRFQLNSALTDVVSEEIIERATAMLGDPTHGVVVGQFFYYISNSGWSELDEHGKLKAGSKLTPARVMRFRL